MPWGEMPLGCSGKGALGDRMIYELVFMRRRNSQVIDVYRTEDGEAFRKIMVDVIKRFGLARLRSGRVNGVRWGVKGGDFVMVSRSSEGSVGGCAYKTAKELFG